MKVRACIYSAGAFRRGPLIRRSAGVWVVFALATLLAGCNSTPKRLVPITGLSSNFEPLRSQFNQDAGKVRLILLLDPT